MKLFYGTGKHRKIEMQRMQKHYSFYHQEQEEAQGKTGAQEIL